MAAADVRISLERNMRCGVGCFGPSPAWSGSAPNTAALLPWLDTTPEESRRVLSTFNVAAFRPDRRSPDRD